MFGEINETAKLIWATVCTAVFLGCMTGLYFWHISKVNTAVELAVQKIDLEQDMRNLKLQERAHEASVRLDETLKQVQKDKDAKIKIANASYDNLLQWVRKQGIGSTASTDGIPDSPIVGKDSRESDFGILHRQDAEALVEYSKDAESLRVEVLSCYQQYDAVKDTLDAFKKENSPKAQK